MPDEAQQHTDPYPALVIEAQLWHLLATEAQDELDPLLEKIHAQQLEIEELRAAGDLLAAALRVETVNGQMAVCDGTNKAFQAWEEARRDCS